MLATNSTPFAALGFPQKHRDGAEMAVLAVRATMLLPADGRLRPAPRQAIVLADEYEGDPQRTPLLRAGDLVPFRPACDVTVLADGRAPSGDPVGTSEVEVRVGAHAFARPAPEGFGPLPPFSEPRRRFAGTYDDAWLASRHPQLPADFDYRFYQVAHPSLVLPGYLRGGEEVALTGLAPGGGRLTFTLPPLSPWAYFSWSGGRRVPVRLNLDGLHLDLRGDAPWWVDLTFRAWVDAAAGVDRIDLRCAALGEADAIAGSDERGLAPAGGGAA